MLMDYISHRASIPKSFDATLLGEVVDNADPEGLGYIKVIIPGILEDDDKEKLPWVVPVYAPDSGGSINSQSFEVPEVGSYVKVKLDPNNPYNISYDGWIPTNKTKPSSFTQPSPINNLIQDGIKKTQDPIELFEEEYKTFTRSSSSNEVTITLDQSIIPSNLAPSTLALLKYIGKLSQNKSIYILSQANTPKQQAVRMYDQVVSLGFDETCNLYNTHGKKVLDQYSKGIAKGRTKEDIIRYMENTLYTVTPTNVSRHCADPSVLNVIDISIKHLTNSLAFFKVAKKWFSLVLVENNAYHLEIAPFNINDKKVLFDKKVVNTEPSLPSENYFEVVGKKVVPVSSKKVNIVRMDTIIKEDLISKRDLDFSLTPPTIEVPSLPEVNLPTYTPPTFEIPEIVIPSPNLPSIPEIPNIDVPSMDIPTISIPIGNSSISIDSSQLNTDIDSAIQGYIPDIPNLNDVADGLVSEVKLPNIEEFTNTINSDIDNVINDVLSTPQNMVDSINQQLFGMTLPSEKGVDSISENYPHTSCKIDSNGNGTVSNKVTKEYQFQHNGVISNIDSIGNVHLTIPSNLKITIGKGLDLDIAQVIKMVAKQLDVKASASIGLKSESISISGDSSVIVKSSGGTAIKGNGVMIN